MTDQPALSAAEIAEIQREHRAASEDDLLWGSGTTKDWCQSCGERWPCDAHRAITAYAASEQARERAERVVDAAKAALDYAGMTKPYPFDRLRQMIRGEASKAHASDYRDYWDFLEQKLDAVVAALTTDPAPVAAAREEGE